MCFMGHHNLASEHVDYKTINLKLNEGMYAHRDSRQHWHHTNLEWSILILSVMEVSFSRKLILSCL